MGTITKLQFKPGIHREGTQFSESGSWYDCDKVRFRSSNPEKIGGWVKVTNNTFKGVCRAMHDWALLNSRTPLALGTHKKIYLEESGVLYDITPVRFSDTKTDSITSGSAGGHTHTYTTSVAHGANAGDYFVISDVSADVDGICADTYTNPFKTLAAGSGEVLVTASTAHYAAVGDTVTFSGTTGFDGVPSGDFNTSKTILEIISPTAYKISVSTNATAGSVTGGGTVTATYLSRLNREFEVLSVPTTTTVTFRTDTPCTTGAVTGGGTDVVADFLIFTGFSVNLTGGGWGTGTWSRQTWSSPLTTIISGITLRIWSFDNYGEDLLFCARDGPIYIWDATSGFSTRGVLVSSLVGASDVPAQVSIVRVTDDRHVLAIGATDISSAVFDPLLVRWCDQEDLTNWTPAADNTAGDLRIPLGSYVVAAKKARQETLVWTDTSLHSIQFTGPPYTFSIQTLAENIDIIGPNAAVNINNITFWMGKNKFWTYSGRVQNIPCDVQRFVFDSLNVQQGSQTYATADHNFTEVTWYYCDNTSEQVNRYVTYNYEQNIWYYGSMPRSARHSAAVRGSLPYGTDGGYTADDGTLFLHEVNYDDGSTNPPSPIEAYIESSDVSIADGDRLMFVDRIIPDLTFTRSTINNPTVNLVVQAKKFPGQEIQSEDSRNVAKEITSTVDRFTNQVWARLRGREMRFKISSSDLGVSWILGAVRVALRLDGKQ
jgi:hypothetical protein